MGEATVTSSDTLRSPTPFAHVPVSPCLLSDPVYPCLPAPACLQGAAEQRQGGVQAVRGEV